MHAEARGRCNREYRAPFRVSGESRLRLDPGRHSSGLYIGGESASVLSAVGVAGLAQRFILISILVGGVEAEHVCERGRPAPVPGIPPAPAPFQFRFSAV